MDCILGPYQMWIPILDLMGKNPEYVRKIAFVHDWLVVSNMTSIFHHIWDNPSR